MPTQLQDALVVTGASSVFGQWGPFMDRVASGQDVIITYSREHGRAQGRSMTSEVRCVAISVDRYEELAAHATRTVPYKEIGSYDARQGISVISDNILSSSIAGKPVHYRIMFKRQAASVRHRNGRRQELKAQPGYARAYLVSARWYAHQAGISLKDLEQFALASREDRT